MKNLFFSFLVIIFAAGCKEESLPTTTTGDKTITVSDVQLYQMATTTVKAAYFKNSPDTIPGNSGAAHAGKILVWYNAKAKTQLDAQGKVKASPSFSDSSLIVKEIFNSNGARQYIAIMFKLSTASNKGPGDWVWAELESNGQPFMSAADKGAGCAGCHSSGIGYTRMNDTHP